MVDDEAAVREITRATLEASGYRVLIAKDGPEALSICASHKTEIQAVLMDMVMPLMDGSATIRAYSIPPTNAATEAICAQRISIPIASATSITI